MTIEKATLQELPAILEIYANARAYMRENGNLTQWAGGYPSKEIVTEDIRKQQLYLAKEDGETVGVFCYFEGIDPTYVRIYEGEWLNDRPYGVLHRIAVASHRKGVASACFAYCFSRCGNLKIDTHRDNLPMQRSLEKNGFTRCGIIYLESGDERLAYQKA